jgi:hypothetical protein
MTLEQTYFRDRLRRHNRYLHGWGVVCGAKVCAPAVQNGAAEPWTITVTPGYILGPCGDEIVIDCQRTWDVRGGAPSGATGEPPVDYPDPWCSQVFVEKEGPVYIAVKYREIPSRPVRVQPVGCGCGENQCVYSRWRDGYEFGVLSDLPETHTAEPAEEDGDCPTCPPCCTDPWVVLARVEFDGGGKIVSIANCTYRRLVVSFASEWKTCTEPPASGYEEQTEQTGERRASRKADEAQPAPAVPKRSTARRRNQPGGPETTSPKK